MHMVIVCHNNISVLSIIDLTFSEHIQHSALLHKLCTTNVLSTQRE